MKNLSYLWCTDPNIFLSVSHMLSRTYNILSYVAFTAFYGCHIFANSLGCHCCVAFSIRFACSEERLGISEMHVISFSTQAMPWHLGSLGFPVDIINLVYFHVMWLENSSENMSGTT